MYTRSFPVAVSPRGLGEGSVMTPQHATPAVSSTVGLQRLFYKLVQAAKDNAPRGVDDYSFLIMGAGRYRVAVIPVWTTEIVGGRLSAIRVYNLIVREPGRSGLTWNRRYSGGVEAVANQMADALAEAAGLSRGALGRRLGTSRLFGLGQGHESAHTSNVGRDGRSTSSVIESIGTAIRNVAEGTAAVVREGERASVARAGGSSDDAPPPDMSMGYGTTTTGFLSTTGGKVLLFGGVGLAVLATVLFLTSRSKTATKNRRRNRRRRRSMGQRGI